MHASIIAPQEPATGLVKMCPETVEGNPKAGKMEDIADEKTLTLRKMIAVPQPKTGAKELLPIRTWRP